MFYCLGQGGCQCQYNLNTIVVSLSGKSSSTSNNYEYNWICCFIVWRKNNGNRRMGIGQNEKKKIYINWNILSFWGKIAKKKKKSHIANVVFTNISSFMISITNYSQTWIDKNRSFNFVLFSYIFIQFSNIYSRYVSFFSCTTVYSQLYLFHLGRNFFENSILEDRQWNGDFPSADLIQILTAFNNLTCVGVNKVGFVDSSRNIFKWRRTFVVHAFLTTAISIALAIKSWSINRGFHLSTAQ